jgi:hypothetical protein
MKVPALFFGTSGAVASRLRRVATLINRGALLQTVLPVSDLLDISGYPNALLCLEVSRLGLGGEHFRLDQFMRAILFKIGISHENVLREESSDFLASTPWGCLLLNSPQAYGLCIELPFTPGYPSRRAFVAILSSTCANWDLFGSLGPRFHGMRGASDFAGTRPLAKHILAKCGFDSEGMDASSIRDVCEKNQLVSRLTFDDAFWEEVRSGRRGDAFRLARQARM